jgi:hypothetical protein
MDDKTIKRSIHIKLKKHETRNKQQINVYDLQQ